MSLLARCALPCASCSSALKRCPKELADWVHRVAHAVYSWLHTPCLPSRHACAAHLCLAHTPLSLPPFSWRQVVLGRVHWVSLGGIIGLAPLMSMGPLSVGPSPLERSCLSAPQVRAGVRAHSCCVLCAAGATARAPAGVRGRASVPALFLVWCVTQPAGRSQGTRQVR